MNIDDILMFGYPYFKNRNYMDILFGKHYKIPTEWHCRNDVMYKALIKKCDNHAVTLVWVNDIGETMERLISYYDFNHKNDPLENIFFHAYKIGIDTV